MVRTLSQMQCRRIAALEAAVWMRTEDQRTTYRVVMSGNVHPPAPHGYAGVRAVARLTFAELFRDRVTGLAAEAAFFALLSLPPLVLGLVGTIGYFRGLVGADTIAQIRGNVLEVARHALSAQAVDQVLRPTLDNVLAGGRPDVVSIGFLLSLWSGSRALHVYVDVLTVSYGLTGHRSIVRTRALSFGLYVAAVAVGVVVIPLLLAGPGLIGAVVHSVAVGDVARAAYWPFVVLVSIVSLATLYHLAVPVRTPWVKDLPGAVVALLIWLLGSWLARRYLEATVNVDSTYGSLASPVAVLLWLYVTALAVLIGAELNAAIDEIWPSAATAEARRRPPPHPQAHELSMRRE